MTTSIPASAIVDVTPSVIGAGGSANNLNGLVLTNNTRVPIGTVAQFANEADVGDFFGDNSDEAAVAAVYFNGFDNSNVKPDAIYFAQYNQLDVAAYLRGGDISGVPLSTIQSLSGSLTLIIDGYSFVVTSVSLAAATSQSSAASLLQAAVDAVDPTEASFTASIGAAITASMGGSFTTCTSSGTTLTVGAVSSGYLSAGDDVSGTDSTNSLPAGCHIIHQIDGTPGGAGTYELSAAATPGDLTSCTVTGTSSIIDATVVTGLISIGDTITGSTVPADTTVVSQLTGTTGGVGTYQLSCSAQGIASESMVASSTILDVTVCATPDIAVGQTLAGSGVTGTPTITDQISGTAGGIGKYRISGTQLHIASEAMTGIATLPTITYDSVSGAFVVTSGITGTPSTAAFATGTLATPLLLTEAKGAVLSQGAATASPSSFMTDLTQVNRAWATFMTMFDPDSGDGNTEKLAFALWTSQQNNQYAYICTDTDEAPTVTVPAVDSLGYLLKQSNYSGICPIFDPDDINVAAFVLGAVASIDFTETNGRATLAEKSQSGITPTVTNQTVMNNLIANYYNFYGAYAAKTVGWNFFFPGSVSGDFAWLDSYVNQIWLNAQLQVALMNLLTTIKSIPFNPAGAALIEAACQDPINAAVTFGAIRAGVTLSAAQIAEVNAAAGVNIAPTLQTTGWYLQFNTASPTVRAARGPWAGTLWYVDGQSVQTINLSSVELQ